MLEAEVLPPEAPEGAEPPAAPATASASVAPDVAAAAARDVLGARLFDQFNAAVNAHSAAVKSAADAATRINAAATRVRCQLCGKTATGSLFGFNVCNTCVTQGTMRGVGLLFNFFGRR